jgi:sortase (surface protein transpeptidase)
MHLQAEILRKLIIPKINVEIPVVYDVNTIEESAVEKGLERGVVHYARYGHAGTRRQRSNIRTLV